VSYCPKCGRRIYKEEKGCEFCGIVNDKSLWQGVGGMKSQTGSLDYEYEETKEKPQKENPPKSIESKREQINQEDTQRELEKVETPKDEKVLSLFQKCIMIVMLFLKAPGGALLGLVGGIFLWYGPHESNRKFGKIMIVMSTVLILVILGVMSMDGGSTSWPYGFQILSDS